MRALNATRRFQGREENIRSARSKEEHQISIVWALTRSYDVNKSSGHLLISFRLRWEFCASAVKAFSGRVTGDIFILIQLLFLPLLLPLHLTHSSLYFFYFLYFKHQTSLLFFPYRSLTRLSESSCPQIWSNRNVVVFFFFFLGEAHDQSATNQYTDPLRSQDHFYLYTSDENLFPGHEITKLALSLLELRWERLGDKILNISPTFYFRCQGEFSDSQLVSLSFLFPISTFNMQWLNSTTDAFRVQ